MNDEPARHRSREQVLDVLRGAEEPLRISEIADRLDVHVNTVRFHLSGLTQSGRVEAVAAEHGRRGRPATAYRVVPRMDPAGPREYGALAAVLADDLAAQPKASLRAVEIGRRWGRSLALDSDAGPARSPRSARGRIRELLDRLGFAPETTEGSDRIAVRSCPFLELATTSTRVVCPIHLGLMRGALESWRSPLTADRLEAFVEPDLCLVHLGPASGGVAT